MLLTLGWRGRGAPASLTVVSAGVRCHEKGAVCGTGRREVDDGLGMNESVINTKRREDNGPSNAGKIFLLLAIHF